MNPAVHSPLMNLDAYIAHIGIHAAAKLFGRPVHTVRAWRYGTRRPSVEAAYEIIDATGGKLTLEHIYPRPEKKVASG